MHRDIVDADANVLRIQGGDDGLPVNPKLFQHQKRRKQMIGVARAGGGRRRQQQRKPLQTLVNALSCSKRGGRSSRSVFQTRAQSTVSYPWISRWRIAIMVAHGTWELAF